MISEPAILVKRKKRGNQIWSMEKFENKLIDMRDMYEERKTQGLPMMVQDDVDDDDSSSVCVLSMMLLSLRFIQLLGLGGLNFFLFIFLLLQMTITHTLKDVVYSSIVVLSD